MILVDANVLLYAHDASDPRHQRARAWLEEALGTESDVRFGLTTLLAFVRISTDARVYAQPRTPADALHVVEVLLAQPNVAIATPGDRHWRLLAELADDGQARGPVLMDAHLAALAMEHGARLATTDRDFRRFGKLRTIDPLAG